MKYFAAFIFYLLTSSFWTNCNERKTKFLLNRDFNVDLNEIRMTSIFINSYHIENEETWIFANSAVGSEKTTFSENTYNSATAVSASSAFPFIFKPLKIYDELQKKIYLADGGLSDNYGLEYLDIANTSLFKTSRSKLQLSPNHIFIISDSDTMFKPIKGYTFFHTINMIIQSTRRILHKQYRKIEEEVLYDCIPKALFISLSVDIDSYLQSIFSSEKLRYIFVKRLNELGLSYSEKNIESWIKYDKNKWDNLLGEIFKKINFSYSDEYINIKTKRIPTRLIPIREKERNELIEFSRTITEFQVRFWLLDFTGGKNKLRKNIKEGIYNLEDKKETKIFEYWSE